MITDQVLEFITPDSEVTIKDVLLVSLETPTGQISVLKHHKNLLTTISTGKIVITHHNHTTTSYILLEGILIVKKCKIIVVTDVLVSNSQNGFNDLLHKLYKLEENIKSSHDYEKSVMKIEISKYLSLKNCFIIPDLD